MNNFLKYALVTTLSLLSFSSFSQIVYDTNQDNEVAIGLLTGAGTYSFDLHEETSTSATNNRTHLVYLPIAGSTSAIDNRDFSYHANRDQLPQISGGTSTDGANLLRFNLYLDVVGSFTYLNVGISSESSPTSFEVIGSIDFPSYGDGSRTINIDLKDICDYDSDVFDCSKFNFSDNPADNDEFSLFFFLEEESMANAASVNKEDYSGVVYRVKVSNRVYTSLPRMESLTKGDSQLVATVDGYTMDIDFDSWYSYADASTCTDTATNETLSDLGISRTNLTDQDNASIDGEVRISGLTNGTCYSVRLFECDFYGFCSYSTEQKSGTPEEIEALLEKQACFFFTAGFSGEHYIVTFFQHWRDHFLKRFWLGRQFIRWYYHTAPQYTPFILERPWLQTIIKSIGYILYGVIRTWWIILMGFILISSRSMMRRKYSTLMKSTKNFE